MILIELAALVRGAARLSAASPSFQAPHLHPLGDVPVVPPVGAAVTWTYADVLAQAGKAIPQSPGEDARNAIQEPQISMPGVAVLGRLP